MQMLLIAYDLAERELNETAMTTVIRRIGERWARPLASVWYVETNVAAADIEAELAELLGTGDGLVVQATAGEAVVANTMLRWTPSRRSVEEHAAGDGFDYFSGSQGAARDGGGVVIPWPGIERTAA